MVSGKIVAETLEWKKEGEGMLNPTSEEPRIKKRITTILIIPKLRLATKAFPTI